MNYAWPSDWRVIDFELALVPNVRSSPRTYGSGMGAVIDLLGEAWEFVLTLPPVTLDEAGARSAYFNRLHGQVHRVSLWNMQRPRPKGTISGAPVTNGLTAQGAGAVVLTTTPGLTMLAGDMFGVGGQLFQAAENATANGSGVLTIPTANRARAQIADLAPVTLIRPTSTFVLLDSRAPVKARTVYAERMTVGFREDW